MLKKLMLSVVLLFALAHGKSQIAPQLNLLPVPKSVAIQSGPFQLNQNFGVAIHSSVRDTILVKAVNRMYQTLNRRTGIYFKQARIRSLDDSDTAALQVNIKKAATPAIGNN